MKFGTSIHCMDGRIQEPIRTFLKAEYGIDYVDTITEPGPCRVLAENGPQVASILARVNISVNHHGSKLIAVSGHHDCAGNPCEEFRQKEQTRKAMVLLQQAYPPVKVIGLWVNSNWTVHEI